MTLDILPALHGRIARAFDQRDLDGYIAALVLQTAFVRPNVSPWTARIAPLFGGGPPASLKRTHDVAVAGVRLAFGDAPSQFPGFIDAAKLELTREPLPPAACCADDERLLLGVCAGVGAIASEVRPSVQMLLANRPSLPVRQVLLDLWAEALAIGAPRLNAALAARAMACIVGASARGSLSEGDSITMLWMTARLFDAPWRPTDDQLRQLEEISRDCHRAVTVAVSAGYDPTSLDAALLVDAMSASLADRFSRHSVVQSILMLVDHFGAAASVLARRQRSREPLVITDEYDVQDLFQAFALPIVPDLVPEDPASKVAGKGSRLDFTSRSARLGIEAKCVRDAGHADRVRTEILVDEATYQTHPYMDTVVVFVFDPRQHVPLATRAAFEADLSQTVRVADRSVRYIVRVR